MRNKQQPKIFYEPEADVLSYELSSAPIDSVFEMGNVIVHITKRNTPVLVEILDAATFIRQANKAWVK